MSTPIPVSRLVSGTLLLILISIPLLFFAYQVRPAIGGDFRGFLVAGDRFLAGDFLYLGSGVASNVAWPPFFAIFISPFSLIAHYSMGLSQEVWYLFNLILFFLSVDVWYRFYTGRPIQWFAVNHPDSVFSPPILLTLLMVIALWFKVMEILQMNTIVLYLMSLSLFLGHKNRENEAGIVMGLVIAIKAFPLLAASWFLFRRQYRAFFISGFAALFFTLLPVLRYGPEAYIQNVEAWIQVAFSGGYPISGLNQSLYALIGRWASVNPFDYLDAKILAPEKGSFPDLFTVWSHRVLLLISFGWVGFKIWKSKDPAPVISAAIIIILTLLFSPIAWRNYFIISLPGYLILNLYLHSTPDKRVKTLLWSAFFLTSVLFVLGETHIVLRNFVLSVMSQMTIGTLILLIPLFMIYNSAGKNSLLPESQNPKSDPKPIEK
ncbi:MAG: DUF2029 domain-containing protein [Bacteroidetes bacterium]|nr:DUF2029 domain-containing protein [Bacteroidota bacterium]